MEYIISPSGYRLGTWPKLLMFVRTHRRGKKFCYWSPR